MKWSVAELSLGFLIWGGPSSSDSSEYVVPVCYNIDRPHCIYNCIFANMCKGFSYFFDVTSVAIRLNLDSKFQFHIPIKQAFHVEFKMILSDFEHQTKFEFQINRI